MSTRLETSSPQVGEELRERKGERRKWSKRKGGGKGGERWDEVKEEKEVKKDGREIEVKLRREGRMRERW